MGNRKNTWKRKVRVDITAIALNLKPGYMFDSCKITPEEARTFLSEVLEGFPKDTLNFKYDLNILVIKDDIFVVRFDSLIKNIDNLTPNQYFTFDKQLDETKFEICQSTLQYLRETFVKFQKDEKETPGIFQLEIEPNWSMTYIWGVILGFPVILIQPELNVESPPLTNHKIYLKMEPKLTEKINVKCYVPFQHLLYSFSYPVDLTNKFDTIVCKWFNTLLIMSNNVEIGIHKIVTNEDKGVIVF